MRTTHARISIGTADFLHCPCVSSIVHLKDSSPFSDRLHVRGDGEYGLQASLERPDRILLRGVQFQFNDILAFFQGGKYVLLNQMDSLLD